MRYRMRYRFLYPSLTDAIKQKNVRYRIRYRMRYRKKCDIACDIAWDIASGPVVDNSKYAISYTISHTISHNDAISHAISYKISHKISLWCDIEWISFAISCTIFSPVPALCACSGCSRHARLPLLLLLVPHARCLHRRTAGWCSWCLAARISSPWNGYNVLLQPCSWRKWNVTARPACLICRLGPVIRADATVWLWRWGLAAALVLVQVQVQTEY